MYQSVYHLIQSYHFLNESYHDVNSVKFEKPTCLAIYGAKKSSKQSKTLIEDENEIEGLIQKYSLDQFRQQKKLDLKLNFESKLDTDFLEDVLKPSRKLDPILRLILKKKNFFQLRSDETKLVKLDIDFLSYRSTFTNLLKCQFITSKKFIIHAELFKGTIYLQLEEFEESFTGSSQFTYAGHKFELYCCKEFENEEKNKNRHLLKAKSGETKNDKTQDKKKTCGKASEEDELNEFKEHVTKDLCLILRSRINQHSLLYSAEADCFESFISPDDVPIDSDLIQNVELKTSKKQTHPKQEINFRRFKTINIWAQSVLVNVKKIAIGFWDENLVVDNIKEYSLDDLVAMSEWSPKICFFQLNNILSFIKTSFKESKQTKLRFTYDKFSKKIVCHSSDKQVVPDFYKNEFVN